MRWFVALLLIMLPLASLAEQQKTCMPATDLYKYLKTVWHETRKAAGLVKSNDQVFLEIWSAEKTYSIFITSVKGDSCVLVVGNNLIWFGPTVEGEEASKP